MSDQSENPDNKPKHITLFGKRFNLPHSRIGRVVVGTLLIIGGCLGFLPVLGFWMIPVGIMVLSHDIFFVRRFKYRMRARWKLFREARKSAST